MKGGHVVREGDRVMVVLEGVARFARFDQGRHFWLGAGGVANCIDPEGGHVVSVDVVKRAQPKVGDVISRAEARDLPAGSAVANREHPGDPVITVDGSRRLRQYSGELIDINDHFHGATYEVVYIPGGSQ